MCYHMSNSYLKRSLDYKKGKFSLSLNCSVHKYYAAKTQSVQSLDDKDKILAMFSGMCESTVIYRLVQ